MSSSNTKSSQPTPDDQVFEVSLRQVLEGDFEQLRKARKNYGESWCKRGGVGAYMMLARKIDRIENFLSTHHAPSFQKYDILTAIAADQRPEGLIDDVRDLRRYLELIEAKLIETGVVHAEVKKDAEQTYDKAAGPDETVVSAFKSVGCPMNPLFTVGNTLTKPTLSFTMQGATTPVITVIDGEIKVRGSTVAPYALGTAFMQWVDSWNDDTPGADKLHPA